MNHLDLLRTVSLTGSTGDVGRSRLPSDELRFVLEYPERPNFESERDRLASLLNPAFVRAEPLAQTGDLARFLVLRVPGVQRTLPQRDLFGIAYALADACDLVSVEPELGASLFVDPEPSAGGERVESTDMLGPLCWVPGEAPVDRTWALKNIRAEEAWLSSIGEGVLIGQPDTGVAEHAELGNGMLRIERGFDFLEGDPDPTDPLLPDTANPGHGTSTSSVAASRRGGAVTGSAPGAEIVPIRCIDDVRVLNGAAVARAIAHAASVGCHVVSLSLGGVPSRAVHSAIREAISRNVIVLAAAGNCVRTVVWPARYSDVIAVAGTNIDDRPWRGSCRGHAVDISAPAEFVWRAQRSAASDPRDGISGGQGTSYAVALTAGVAALWLAHHGKEAVARKAAALGMPVQRLFRAALRQTARKPDGWDDETFGAGIVDSAALLALSLDGIEVGTAESVEGSARSSIESFLDEEIGPSAGDPEFPVARYSSELGAIGLAQAKIAGGVGGLSAEAKTPSTRPSPQLAAAARNSRDVRLRRFSSMPQATSVERPLALPAGTVSLQRLRHALKRRGTGLEATGVRSLEEARGYLTDGGIEQQLKKVDAQLSQIGLSDSARRETVESAQAALERIARDEPIGTIRALVGLEALVSLTGRPVIPVRNDTVDYRDPRAGEWEAHLLLVTQNGRLQERIRSVGRIEADGEHIGTGFVVAPGVVLTNRHVLQALAAPVPTRNRPERWVMTSDDVFFDTADRPSSATAATRFKFKSVLATGPDHIEMERIDFSDLDVALLEVETTSVGGEALPPQLSLSANVLSADRGADVIVIGYPARPGALPTTTAGDYDMEVVTRLGELFGNDYGVKYIAPGKVSQPVGAPRDVNGWTFDHDATTLGGNSGSCVVSFQGPMPTVGLHFGGKWLSANYAHALGAIGAHEPLLGRQYLSWV